ncbi:MAG: hypothetical protein ACREV9_16855 [Burkholderiales bacterium]
MKRVLATLLAASLVGGVFAGNSYFFGDPIKDAELDKLRGGLTLPTSAGQLNLSFGIERMVVINDELIAVTQMLIPELTSAMRKGAGNAGATKQGTRNVGAGNAGAGTVKAAGFAPVVVIQTGPGNTAMPDIAQLNAAIGTVIQNTLNQQHIQTSTVITVTANSMELTRAMALQAATSQALIFSLR